VAGGRLNAFSASYAALVDVVEGLGEDAAWAPTGCLGWSVRDLVFHLHADATRGLVALHTPADRSVDCDAVDYWRAWGSDSASDEQNRRFTRLEAGLFGWPELRARYLESARATARGIAEADPSQVVATQGHVLTLADLASTLAVEATLHHLDLVDQLPAAGPSAAGLAEVRRVVEALLDRDLVGWSDERVSLVGTGRGEPTSAELEDLGSAVVPVFT
jgi:hypothetical protein